VTNREIIEAAFRVWGRDFYKKTSLSELAKALKVSKPALYRHFDSKEALNAAMIEYFFDSFAGSVRADFEKAQSLPDADEGVFTIVSSIAGYFARNEFALIFALINIYERNLSGKILSERIRERGADMTTLHLVIEKKYNATPALLQLIFATLTFLMGNFHLTNKTCTNPLSEEAIKKIISTIYEIIKHGLGITTGNGAGPDYEKLEKQVEAITIKAESEPFFKAVAEAVAEAGPWEVSMDMVAKRMGLSKSSLYGHFINKEDMLRRLFISEFQRIIEFAKLGIKLSETAAEQLYLGIYAISVYFRARPEVLIAMGWLRTRKFDLGKPNENLEIFRLFEDINITPAPDAANEERQKLSHWILFLLINILSRPYLNKDEWPFEIPSENTQNHDLRMLYKFITLGLGGFTK
jgi:AcrR family transcriptional regulator